MSARIPPGFAETWCRFDLPGDAEPMFISLGLDLASGETPSLATTNNFDSVWQTNLDNVLSSSYSVGPGFTLWGQDGGDIRIDATNTPEQGDQAGNPLPPNCAVLVQKRTALGGRRNRGRFYVPGIPEGNVDEVGTIAGATLSTWQTIVNDILSTFVALLTVDACVLLHNTAPFAPTPITDLEVAAKIATQRRRLRP